MYVSLQGFLLDIYMYVIKALDTHTVSRGAGTTWVCFVLHGHKCLDAGELLFVAASNEGAPLHHHTTTGHPRRILVTLKQ